VRKDITLKTNKFVNLLEKLILELAFFYDDKWYRLYADKNSEPQLKEAQFNSNRCLMLIAGRRHYNEMVRLYPVDKQSEVSNLVKLEFEGQRFHYIIAKMENGKAHVNVWVYAASLPDCLFVFPESLLLANNKSANQILVSGYSRSYFLSKQNGLVYSQLCNALIDTPANFAMAIGMANNNPAVEIPPSNMGAALISGMRALSVAQLKSFISLPKVAITGNVGKILYTTGIILGLYLFASSAYLTFNKQQLLEQTNSQNEDIKAALVASERVENDESRYSQLFQFIDGQQDISKLWFVLAELFPEAQFSVISYDNGRFILVGKAEHATEVLEKVHDNPYVLEAHFDNPTRREKNKESFVISFVLNKKFDKVESKEAGQ
jgi:hypothetical protein